MKKLEIAVVGGGAGCVAFLHHFVDAIDADRAGQVRIKVFERRGCLGPGLAYQGDCESILLNRAAHTMSASGRDLSTFTAWLRWKGLHLQDIRQWADQDLSSAYVARPVFGRFLEEFASETCASARRKGFEIEVVHEAVTSIHKDEGRIFIGTNGREEAVDRVVLAVGNTEPSDFYNLRAHVSYVNNPYPLQERLTAWKRTDRICILGTSLTGVDIAVSLKRAGYQGRIDMISRPGLLPYVRGQQGEPHLLRFLTPTALAQATKRHGGTLPLNALLRLLRRELRSVGEDWQSIFTMPTDAKTTLRTEIKASRGVRPWQKVLAATNEIIEQAWNALSKDSQRLVQERFSRCWMARRAPMPQANGELLLQMLETGQLHVMGCEPCFDTSEETVIRGSIGASEKREYGFVINATGASRWIRSSADSPLIWQMLVDGYAVENEHGGVSVDFETASLVDVRGVPDRDIRVLGHLTSGTYFFVSSLEMIAKKAYRVADQLVSDIQHTRSPQRAAQGVVEFEEMVA